MKLLLLLLLVIACPASYLCGPVKIELRNYQPCAYVKRIVISEMNGDGKVDVIQYVTSSVDTKSIYFYRGASLWDYWKGNPPALQPDVGFDANHLAPQSEEIGNVDLVGKLLAFSPLKSYRMKRNFKKADKLLAAYRVTGSVTPEIKQKFQSWIIKRFKNDVIPDPRILCANVCDCTERRPAYVK